MTALRYRSLKRAEVSRVVGAKNLRVSRQGRLQRIQTIQQAGDGQSVMDHPDPIGTLGMASTHLMLEAIVMREVGHWGHRSSWTASGFMIIPNVRLGQDRTNRPPLGCAGSLDPLSSGAYRMSTFARQTLVVILSLGLTACGSDAGDPVLDYLDSAGAASVAGGLTITPAGLLQVQAGPAQALLSNGSFDAAPGPTTDWTQRTHRTRFGTLGDLIGAVPAGLPAAPYTTVARICGYPYTFRKILPEGGFDIDQVSCSDRLTSADFTIPATTTALSLQADASGQITCGGTWTTLIALMPVAEGPKVPTIQIKPTTAELRSDRWTTFRFEIPSATVAGMVGKPYRLIVQGMSGTCQDPLMEESVVLISGLKVEATLGN